MTLPETAPSQLQTASSRDGGEGSSLITHVVVFFLDAGTQLVRSATIVWRPCTTGKGSCVVGSAWWVQGTCVNSI